jgi:hypothetical protein
MILVGACVFIRKGLKCVVGYQISGTQRYPQDHQFIDINQLDLDMTLENGYISYEQAKVGTGFGSIQTVLP